ncbi:MAG: hypothetical protein JO021_09660, partial [Alphaproteobacteria bacterium]|nr:hypothetical protein [Alphaproteobacteria bacterium]
MRPLDLHIAGDRSDARRRALSRAATALAVLALLFQATLPLVDAQLHRRAHTLPTLGIAVPGDP